MDVKEQYIKKVKDRLEVMQAYLEGVTVQMWHSTSGWRDININNLGEPNFSLEWDYRLKPLNTTKVCWDCIAHPWNYAITDENEEGIYLCKEEPEWVGGREGFWNIPDVGSMFVDCDMLGVLGWEMAECPSEHSLISRFPTQNLPEGEV